MKVTIRDRSAEGAWGSGPINPCIVTVEIADNCPVPGCGAKRGEPRHLRQVDDGAWYSVQVWDNPCGHVDMYADVVKEAKALAVRTVEHVDYEEAAAVREIEREMAIEAGDDSEIDRQIAEDDARFERAVWLAARDAESEVEL